MLAILDSLDIIPCLCFPQLNTVLVIIPAGRVPTSENCDSCVPKFIQSILELPATDEIHIMEDEKKVWPELSPELIRPMAYTVCKTVNRVAQKQLHLNLEQTK